MIDQLEAVRCYNVPILSVKITFDEIITTRSNDEARRSPFSLIASDFTPLWLDLFYDCFSIKVVI